MTENITWFDHGEKRPILGQIVPSDAFLKDEYFVDLITFVIDHRVVIDTFVLEVGTEPAKERSGVFSIRKELTFFNNVLVDL